MNVKALKTLQMLLTLMLMAGQTAAQGFAGLGSSADGFSLPRPGVAFDFPRDHGAHPDFRIEWWYVTANLKGSDGKDYGIQWTLFRSALSPEEGQGWASPQVWMGHAALTTADRHYVAERLARGGIGQAGVTLSPFRATIDDWSMVAQTPDTIDRLSLTAAGQDFRYDLSLAAEGPIVLQGDKGYSVKSAAGQASYYYSQPFYRVSGTLSLPQGQVQVAGLAWLDREWSSQPLAADQQGWDWFSLHFDDGTRLMGYHLRGKASDYTVASWITSDGRVEAMPPGALKLTPLAFGQVAGRTMPLRWRLELPEKGLDVETRALNADSWMAVSFPYWEGPIFVTGSHAGRGYLEMTGY